ncbi:MAG: pyridoxal-phosphate dependent enzyme [Methylococcales bacterium]
MHPKLSALQALLSPSPLTRIIDPWLNQFAVELWLKRDDLIHPVISGNKWRKLKYVLQHALSVNADTLISMGGAYSNHLHALAFAGQFVGLKTIGLIRGEKQHPLNPTLKDLQQWGMTLNYIPRQDYRQLRQYQNWQALPELLAGHYWLPEGGAVTLALQGIAELVAEINQPDAVLCVPCGTGTTLAGIVANSSAQNTILGFAALKGADFLIEDVQRLLPTNNTPNNWSINLDYHCGGFGKTTPALLAFIQQFEQTTGIPLDPVYTGKMLFGIYDLIAQGYFQQGQRIIALHTGGLQGKRGRVGQ